MQMHVTGVIINLINVEISMFALAENKIILVIKSVCKLIMSLHIVCLKNINIIKVHSK